MSISEKFSFWLEPEGNAYEKYEALIRDLSKRYGAPAFSPHVTLIGGVTGERNGISSMTGALALELRPFEISFNGIGYLDEYYRCLFLRAEDTRELFAAYTKAEDIFGVRHSRPFMPHLSLMYGEYSASLKEQIIGDIGSTFPPGFRAEALSLYCTGGRPQDWGLIGKFPFGRS